jgi:hypothetical protein
VQAVLVEQAVQQEHKVLQVLDLQELQGFVVFKVLVELRAHRVLAEFLVLEQLDL